MGRVELRGHPDLREKDPSRVWGSMWARHALVTSEPAQKAITTRLRAFDIALSFMPGASARFGSL